MAQVHVYPAQDTNNTFTGQNNFNNTVVFGHTWSFGSSSISNQSLGILFAGLGCTSGQVYVPFSGTCATIGSSALPAGPAFAVNFANSGVTGLQGDSLITINPTLHSMSAPVLNGIQNEQLYTGALLANRITAACTALGGTGGLVLIPATETSTDSGYVAMPGGCIIEDHRGTIFASGNGVTTYTNPLVGTLQHSYWSNAPINTFQHYITWQTDAQAVTGGLNTYDGSTGVKTSYQVTNENLVTFTPGQHFIDGKTIENNSPGDTFLLGAQIYDTGWATAAGDEGLELMTLYLFGGMPALTATISSIASSTLTMTCGANCSQLGEQQPIINTSRGVQNTGTATITNTSTIPPVVTITGGIVTCPGGTNPCSSSTQNGVGLYFEFTGETFSGHHIVMPVIAVNAAGTQLTLLIQHRSIAPTTPVNTAWEGKTTSGPYAVYNGSTITAVPYTSGIFTTIQATVASTSIFQTGDSIMVPGGNNRNMNGYNYLAVQNVPCPSNGGCFGFSVTSQGQYPIVNGFVVNGNLRFAAFQGNWVGAAFAPTWGVTLQGTSSAGYYQAADWSNLTSTEQMLCAGNTTNGSSTCMNFYRTAGATQNFWQMTNLEITGTAQFDQPVQGGLTVQSAIAAGTNLSDLAGGQGFGGNLSPCSYFATSCISSWGIPSGAFALASVTQNSAQDIWGNSTVELAVTDSSASNAHPEGQQENVPVSLSATTQMVYSLYFRTDLTNPAAQINISFSSGPWGNTCSPANFSNTVNLTTTLTRAYITCAVPATTTSVNPGWVTFTPSAHVYVWCSQLETGFVPSSCHQTPTTSSLASTFEDVFQGQRILSPGPNLNLGAGTATATSFANANGTVIPSTATGDTGSGTLLVLAQTGTTGNIGGSALAAGACATGTVTLTTATGHAGVASASDGTVQGNYALTVSVNGTTATVSVCAITAGTPTTKTYNVIVF